MKTPSLYSQDAHCLEEVFSINSLFTQIGVHLKLDK